jgi:hypothetical protein
MTITTTGLNVQAGGVVVTGPSSLTGGLTLDTFHNTGSSQIDGNLTTNGTVTASAFTTGGGLNAGNLLIGSTRIDSTGTTTNNLHVTAGTTLDGGLTSAGTLTAAGLGISGNSGLQAVTATSITANNLTVAGLGVSGNTGLQAVTATSITASGACTFNGATHFNTDATFNNILADGRLIAPSGGGGLPVDNGMVINPSAGAAVALQVNADIQARAGGTGDGRVDAAGGFYVSGTPHMLTGPFGSLFQALLAAPDGRLMISKSGGQFATHVVP